MHKIRTLQIDKSLFQVKLYENVEKLNLNRSSRQNYEKKLQIF